ncbi:MAG: SpoIVB peptidase [Clostridia bacterium]|nr:SpoIVB peptidase [Clostridia bacterium]
MRNKSAKVFSAVLAALLISLPAAAPVTAYAAGTAAANALIPGGMPFGVKLYTKGALVLGTTGIETVSGLTSPAKDCGLRAGDVIVRAGGAEFDSADELIRIVSGSGGRTLVLTFMRGEEELRAEVTPVRELESGKYRRGALVRDSAAGIGTVTYIVPGTLEFGGLGHGIYDAGTSVLMPLKRGSVVNVDISSVVKSERNEPGELHGEFSGKPCGELTANTAQGVFGRFYALPANAGEPIPVAAPGELTEGKASILTTVKGGDARPYEAEIERVYSGSGKTKNFLIKITDKRLLETAGGIVQGMSGSPVIKDGKLVGAVTHVLVNDPARGYGIYIGNMLSASEAGASESAYGLAA